MYYNWSVNICTQRRVRQVRVDPGPPIECRLIEVDLMPVDKVTIKIPRPLYDRIQQIISHSGFSSPTDFIVYVLRDMVGHMGTGSDQDPLSRDEMESIRRKLKGLGYL